MGILGDFFGGQAKVRALPQELRQLAQQDKNIADRLYGFFDSVGNDAENYLPGVREQMERARQQLAPASAFAEQRAQEARDLWNQDIQPLTRQTIKEIGQTGSLARQNYEAGRARENTMAEGNAMLGQLQRNSARVGFTGAGSPFNAQTALTLSGQAAAQANAARLSERALGEQVRQQFLPGMLQEGDATLQRSLMPSNLSQANASMLSDIAGAGAAMYGRTMPFATAAQQAGNNAYGKFGKNFQHDLYRDQQNAKRRSNMLETGLNVAGQIAGAAMGVPPGMMPSIGSSFRGGSGGGQYGGVGEMPMGNPWSNIANHIGNRYFSGGGGGGGNLWGKTMAKPPPGFGASGAYYPR